MVFGHVCMYVMGDSFTLNSPLGPSLILRLLNLLNFGGGGGGSSGLIPAFQRNNSKVNKQC